MTLRLQRTVQTEFATYGVLLDESGEQLAAVLELPWNDNRARQSCIPAGRYPVVLEYSAKFDRDLFELKDVPGREEVKIHNGNLPEDTDGCLLLGTNFGNVESKKDGATYRGVVNSRVALNAFMLRMAAEGVTEFDIEVLPPAVG